MSNAKCLSISFVLLTAVATSAGAQTTKTDSTGSVEVVSSGGVGIAYDIVTNALSSFYISSPTEVSVSLIQPGNDIERARSASTVEPNDETVADKAPAGTRQSKPDSTRGFGEADGRERKQHKSRVALGGFFMLVQFN